jgi:phosphate-selective porin OprO and OprP
MKLSRWWLAGIAGVQISLPLFAQDVDTIEALKQQIQQLDQKVRILERKRENEQDADAAIAKTTPRVSLGASGFAVTSADSNFVFKVRGYVQADSRWFADDVSTGTANDTFLLRRVRPIFEGTVYDKYDFRVMLDFGSGVTSGTGNNGFVQDAYLNARFRPEFQVQAGKFKEPVSLERLQSGANLLFVERGFPSQLAPNRDTGIQVQGDLIGGALRYEAGVFNGVADGGSDDIEAADDEKDFAGRLFATPFKNSNVDGLRGLGFGVAATTGNQQGALRSFATPGQQRFFAYRTGSGTSPATANVVADGQHWRVVPQAYYYWGPFGIYGEFAISDQRVRRDDGASTLANVRNTAWQVAASYVLTGEENTWKGITPAHPFDPANGGWGAWEIAARIGQLDVDDAAFPLLANPATAASGATSWGVGLNWRLNKNVKANLNYEQTDLTGGTSEFLAKGEKAILTRVQVSF